MSELLYTQEDIDEWIRTCEELQERNRELKQEIAEYKDKIEQGTLVELPCKVGTIVYYVGSYQIGTWKKKIRYDIFEFPFTLEMLDTYGNNWFLTREEAEKRLKELQE